MANKIANVHESSEKYDIIKKKLTFESNPVEIKRYGHIQSLEPVECKFDHRDDINSFLYCILHSYNFHVPLVVNMNVVNNSILDVIATMVEKHCEYLRSKFVNHEGKKELFVWDTETNIIDGYINQIKFDNEMGTSGELLDIINDFSLPTTTICDKQCYNLSLLTMFGNYYTYIMTSCGICGLLFTDDRESIIKSKHFIKSILDYLDVKHVNGMIEWQTSVYGFYDELLNVYDGNPNVNYWSKIIDIKNRGSGGPVVITGHASIFCTNKFNSFYQEVSNPNCNIIYDGATFTVTKKYKCVTYPEYNGKQYYGLVTGIKTKYEMK